VAKLTDLQRKEIIAARVEGTSYRALAKKYGVSPTAIQNVVSSDPKTLQKCTHKKDQNTASVLAHMEAKSKDVCNALDLLLAAMQDPALIAKTPMAQLATTYGILVDKHTTIERKAAEQADGAFDDGFMSAFEERAPELWAAGDDLPGGDEDAPQE